MKKITFRGVPVLAMEGIKGNLAGLNLYGLRHADDDWSRPATVETRFVAVNGYGVLAAARPLDDALFGEQGVLDLEEDERDTLAAATLPGATADAVRAALSEEAPVRFEAITYRLPAHWASAVINDDRSGMEDEEIEAMEEWFRRHAEEHGEGHWTLSTDRDTGEFAESHFVRYHDAYDVVPLACDALEFVWMKRVDAAAEATA